MQGVIFHMLTWKMGSFTDEFAAEREDR